MPSIFVYGEVGVGKSTLCAALINYFNSHNGHAVYDNVHNVTGMKYYRSWLNDIKKKKFPQKTTITTFLEIDIGLIFRENDRGWKKTELTIYEFAGEELQKLNPMDNDNASKDPRLEEWLQKCDAILILVPAVFTSDHADNVHAFMSLLIDMKLNDRPIAFIITKWDRISNNPSGAVKFAADNFKDSLNLLDTPEFHPSADVFGFSIGDVDSKSGEIRRIDVNKGASGIAKWLLAHINL